MSDESRLISEMKALIRHKVISMANCIENSRTQNLEVEVQNTLRMLEQLSMLTEVDEIVSHMERVVCIVRENLSNDDQIPVFSSHTINTGSVGRPCYDIPEDSLEYFIENNFKVSDIAQFFHVSISTIKRRLREYGLSISQTYSAMSDEELESLVCDIKGDFPDAGYQTVVACLMSKGHRVQRSRVRAAVNVVDSDGVLFRKLFFSVCRIQRRTYSVRAPNALWHIDGNHKLIR